MYLIGGGTDAQWPVLRPSGPTNTTAAAAGVSGTELVLLSFDVDWSVGLNWFG